MSYNKFSKIGLVAVLSATFITGCVVQTSASSEDIIDNGGIEPTEVSTEKNVDMPEFDIIGEVIEIDGSDVHILFGDIVEIFKVQNPDDVYLGQTVKVNGEAGDRSLEPYLIKSFEFKHTNMGDIIKTATGTVESVKEGSIKIRTESEVVKLQYYGSAVNVQKGDSVDVEYVQFGTKLEDMTVIHVFPLESAMTLTVDSMERAEDGLLIIKGTDEEGLESYVDVRPGSNDNFNLSELKVGDEIEVIPEVVMESYPMQVVPLRIRVISE